MSMTQEDQRVGFFNLLFEEREGFLCVAWQPKGGHKKEFKQKFFMWPEQSIAMENFIQEKTLGHNLWFGVNLFRRPERTRDFAVPTTLLWADLDYCDPGEIDPAPQFRLQSSPKKYQGFWRLDEVILAEEAQTLSKRIAYAYKDKGADVSGWDIEQLLRVPYTYNYKYDDGVSEVPEVQILTQFEVRLSKKLFESLTPPTPEEKLEETSDPLPDVRSLPDAENVVYKYQSQLKRTPFFDLYLEEPNADWSAAMWQLIMVAFEAGLDKEEVFAVALTSKCNKYDRDNRPIVYLWREILKAELKHRKIELMLGDPQVLEIPELFDGSEPPVTTIEDYRNWASKATDAIEEYHELACAMMLSSLTASGLYCHVGAWEVKPNLWGLVMGDTTLTRKTTAMDIAMKFVTDIERDLIVATDGSVEGLLTQLSARPEKVSVWYRDEVQGMFDAIRKRDYMASMFDTFTKLYDVPPLLTRTLRKEVITITKPVFIFFGGGITDSIYAALNDTHIMSGFLPRFLVVRGDADFSKVRPVGPLSPEIAESRRQLLNTYTDLHALYNEDTKIDIPDANTSFDVPTSIEVLLTPEAWEYNKEIYMRLAKEAHESSYQVTAQPTFERLSWSLLKLAMLLAASRQQPKDNRIKLEVKDLQSAAYYIQRWGRHSIDLILNVGRTANERIVSRVLDHVRRNPGCSRSHISRAFHFSKIELNIILDTLEDRGQVKVHKANNGFTVTPL